MQFVTVTIDTSALFSPAQRAYGNLGIAGYGMSGSLTEAKVFEKQSDVETEYGAASAIAKAASLAFQNGAKTIYAIRATATAATQQLFNGDDSTKIFSLNLSADGWPERGSVDVEVDSVAQVEGTDYDVDYGNGDIIFVTAPATGTSNITVDFNVISSTNLETALGILLDSPVQLVVGAMMFDPALLTEIKDHVVAASASGFERMGIAMLPNGNSSGTVETVAVVGTGGALTNQDRMICFGHATLEDVAAACAGLIAKYEPWVSIILKPTSGIVKERDLTSTEETALLTLQVNPIVDVVLIPGSGLYTGEGFTLSGDATKLYIDVMRVIDDITFRLKSGLTNPNTIGTLKINAEGLRTLRGQIRGIMAPRVKAGEIDSFEVEVPLLPIATIPASERTTEQQTELNNAKASRTVEVDVSIEYSGAIHSISINLKFV
jgi:hypothetical protein